MGDHEDENDLTKMPEAPAQEWGLVLAKSLASLIPFAGGPAAEVLGAIITPQIEKSKTEWLENIRRDLYELSKWKTEVTPERLSQDPAFTTAFLHASQIALRTHQREKLQALRNAVLNVAAGTAPDENLQLVFLHYLDMLTPLHLTLLDCVADPREWSARRNYPLAQGWNPDAGIIFEAVYRGQLPAENFHVQLLQDWYTRGLVGNDANPNAFLSPPAEALIPRITDLGKRFLAFITSPIPELDNADQATV